MKLLNRQVKHFDLFTCIWIIFFVVLFNTLRFINLDQAPAGFHVDELSAAVTVMCLEQEGVDALGRPYPLFGDLSYGSPKPPTFMYPAILWIKIFGSSRASFRALNGFFAVLFVLGLFVLCRELFGRQYALFVTLTASLSPWVFQMSRIVMEAGFVPFSIVWGMYFLFKSNKMKDALLAGIFFALAMYAYPPTRLHIPLLLFPLFLFKWKDSEFKWSFLSAFIAGFILTNTPLIIKTLSGELTGRFHLVGIFSEKYLTSINRSNSFSDIIPIFLKNFLTHFDPSFLFLKGDTNLVYSTHQFGQLSWIDTFALLLSPFIILWYWWNNRKNNTLLKSREAAYVAFLSAGILFAIVPSALTWQAIPHSFRIIGMLPFLFMLIGFIIWKTYCRWKYASIILLIVSASFSYQYLNHYFKEYPLHSYYMFDGHTKELASSLKTPKDWLKFGYIYRHKNFHLRYYFMKYGEDHTCSSSEMIYQSLKNLK